MTAADEWLTVESLDLEAQGVAHNAEGKVVFIDGALPGEVVQVTVQRRKNNWEQATAVAWRRESSQRVRPQCPHFGTCGGCKMQHLHVAAQVATKQRALEDALWHLGKVKAEQMLRPIEGPAWGYRYRARLSVRYVAKKGKVLVGFHERKSSYVADMERCEVLPPHLSAMLMPLRELIGGHGPARPPAADRGGGGRRGDGAGAAPPGAADDGDRDRLRTFGADAWRAVVAAAQGAGHGAPARRRRAGTGLHAARVRHHDAVQADRLHPGEPPDQHDAGVARAAPARRAARRARDRLVLRPGQLHAADRAQRRARCWASRAARRWCSARARTPRATAWRSAARFEARNLFELPAGRPGRLRRGRQVAGRPAARRCLRARQGAGRAARRSVAGAGLDSRRSASST